MLGILQEGRLSPFDLILEFLDVSNFEVLNIPLYGAQKVAGAARSIWIRTSKGVE